MQYPSLSELSQDQLRAIGEAKIHGSALFHKEGMTYAIAQEIGHSIVMARDASGQEAGYISTSSQGRHYSIEVPSQFRGRGIGTTLLRTKEALDGILSYEWSGRYSRIYFLLRKGYIPFARVNDFESTSLDVRLTDEDIGVLINHLRKHLQERRSGDSLYDVSSLVVRMKYAPRKAKKFLQDNDLIGPK